MVRKRTSILWTIDKEVLNNIVKKSHTIKEILNHFGWRAAGANYKRIKEKMEMDGIDFSHIPLGKNHNRWKNIKIREPIPLDKILVKKGASIGAGSILLPGITIGEFAMIGSGSVVTKNVPDYGLVYGNPAKLEGYVDKNGKKVREK